jgi:hypothetical protein
MASPSRTAEREEERRLNMRTLVIASVASAAAAVLTSQLWIAGTWIAAGMTPVIVTLVSEMLHRPTERIARSITTDRAALPEAGGAAPPARPDADVLPTRAQEEPTPEPPVRVYRSGEAEPRGARGLPGATTRRRKIAYGAVLATAALAFVIAISALTVSELVAGGSVGKNDARTTLLGGGKKKDDGASDSKAPADTTTDDQDQQEAEPDQQQAPPDDEEQQTTPTDETTTTTTTEEPPPDQETPAPGEPEPAPLPDTQP